LCISIHLHQFTLFLHPLQAAPFAGRLNIMPAPLHYNLHLCQMNPAAEILIGFYGLYTQWCLCMRVWGVRQWAFTEAWRKRGKNQLKNEWKWKNDSGCWGSVGLSGILFLSLALFPSPCIFPYPLYIFTLPLLYAIIAQWPFQCF